MDPPARWEDPYFWLRDDERSSTEVLDHLRAENAYTEARTARLAGFREALNAELRGHLQETDQSWPLPRGPFEYYTRTVEGLSYTIHCRQPAGGGAEDVLLDENALAKDRTYCSVEQVEASPSQRLVAFTADFSGYETYDLFVRGAGAPLEPGTEPELRGIAGFAWGAADDGDLYYTTFDAAHRPSAVWRHVLGTSQEEDTRLFLEADELFYVSLSRSRDGALVLVESDSSETSEVHYIDLAAADGGLRCIRRRKTGVRYTVDHRRGTLLVVTNEGGLRNQVLRCCALGEDVEWRPVMLPGSEGGSEAREVLPHSEHRNLESVHAFDRFVAVTGREDGLSQVWVLEGDSLEGASVHRVLWPDDAYWCNVESDLEFSTPTLRLAYSTLVLPRTDMAYHVPERRLEKLRTRPVPKYDPSLYATARVHAKAPDGTDVPMSLLWRRDKRAPPGSAEPAAPAAAGGNGAVHLYGYGSYGTCMEPSFSMTRLPLVDRGMVFAIAHVRGGSEMGRWKWYEEDGKYLRKKNTFTDFVACAEHLLAQGWAAGPKQISIEGRSAGGLLIGASLNMRPDLFGAVLAGVPFVDILVTMSDPSIPLTCGEWEEWGNPNDQRYFEYMQSYSPVDNVRRQPYPSVLITAGLHDPRVAYWEPAKYAQVLRAQRTNPADDGTEVLLKMDLSVGHFSASDRYRYLSETAFDQAWLLSTLGIGP